MAQSFGSFTVWTLGVVAVVPVVGQYFVVGMCVRGSHFTTLGNPRENEANVLQMPFQAHPE